MKQKSIKKNYIYNVCYQILVLLIPFITTPYLSRVLGAEGVGLNSYANAMISYFTVFAYLGTSVYGQREISYVQENKEKRSRVFFEILIFRITTVFITLIFYGIYLYNIKSNFIIYLILTLNLINVIFDITWFFQGLEEFKKTVLRNAVVKIINIIFIFTFIKDADDLVIYIAGTSILSFLGSLSMWLYIPKYVCKVDKIKPFKNIKGILKLFIPTIAMQVYTLLDKSMLGNVANNYLENGYYEQAEKVYRICLTLVTSLGTVMIPRIGKTFKEGNIAKVREYMYKSYNFIWFLSVPIMFGLIAISNVFVPIFLGNGYDKVEIILPIVSVLVIVIGLSNVNGIQCFIPLGKENTYTLTIIVGAVVNFCLNIILIPKFYSIGACIASVIAEICVTLVGFIYIRKEIKLSLKNILMMSIKYFISGFIMFLSVVAIKSFIGSSVLSLIILILTGAITYIIMLFILKDNFFLSLFNQAINIINNILKKFIKVKSS